jgi:hypothetical protein
MLGGGSEQQQRMLVWAAANVLLLTVPNSDADHAASCGGTVTCAMLLHWLGDAADTDAPPAPAADVGGRAAAGAAAC